MNWSPSVFEQKYAHNFRMRNQLTEKYPQEMGGIYLVPRDHDSIDLKIHKTCPVEDAVFDVFRVDHTELTEETIANNCHDSNFSFNGLSSWQRSESSRSLGIASSNNSGYS